MSCAAPGIPHPVLNSDSGASYPPYSHRVLQATGWSGAPVGVLFWSQHPEALSMHQGRSLRIPLSGSESACVCALSLRPVFGILWDARDCSPPVSSVYGDSPGKNTGVGGHALLQRIFLTQGSNPLSPALAGGFFTTESPGKLSRVHENPTDREVWRATVHGEAKIRTQLSD